MSKRAELGVKPLRSIFLSRCIMSWKEFDLSNNTVADWLPWGGLTLPHVVQEKDGSYFGVIRYKALPEDCVEKIEIPSFKEGWSLWLERQHVPLQEDGLYIVLCWNPFINKAGYAVNRLNKEVIVKAEDAGIYFATVLDDFAETIGKVTEADVLEYQDVIDFMSFAISYNEQKVIMPEVPLYLDALLSQDLDLNLSGNSIEMGGKETVAVSLACPLPLKQEKSLLRAVDRLPFRFVQRLLIMGQEKAEKKLLSYMSKWCGGRKSVKKLIKAPLLGELTGLYANNLFLLTEKGQGKEIERYIRDVLNRLEALYIVEDYNRKDVWWGSLPGLFRANLTPPQMSFDGLQELMTHSRKEA